MGRPLRITEAGVAYHLLNRRVMRLTMFEKDRSEEVLQAVRFGAMDCQGNKLDIGAELLNDGRWLGREAGSGRRTSRRMSGNRSGCGGACVGAGPAGRGLG